MNSVRVSLGEGWGEMNSVRVSLGRGGGIRVQAGQEVRCGLRPRDHRCDSPLYSASHAPHRSPSGELGAARGRARAATALQYSVKQKSCTISVRGCSYEIV